MKSSIIHIEPLTRLAGNAGLSVSQPAECRLEMLDSPREFEAALQGRSWEYVHQIVSRVSGANSLSHQLASVAATEAAFGVEVSPQTALLRKLALLGETLQSHLLNLGFFIVPGLLDADSLLALAQTSKSHSLPFIALHRLGNEIIRVVCGRSIHPQRIVPGGFTKCPGFLELRSIRQRIRAKMPQIMEVARFLARQKEFFPEFHRETPGAALESGGKHVASTRGGVWPLEEWTAQDSGKFRLGALARFNLHHGALTPRAAKVAEIMGLSAPLENPFHYPLARYVEAVMALEQTVALIDGIEETGIRDEAPVLVKPGAGRAAAAVEAPGGILAHDYEYDGLGRIVRARIAFPGKFNLACLRDDLDALAGQGAGEDAESLGRKLSLLVRSYDECFC